MQRGKGQATLKYARVNQYASAQHGLMGHMCCSVTCLAKSQIYGHALIGCDTCTAGSRVLMNDMYERFTHSSASVQGAPVENVNELCGHHGGIAQAVGQDCSQRQLKCLMGQN